MAANLHAAFTFPPGFLWGTATAAHQVEGGNTNSWTAWENQGGGRIYQDQVSGRACEWWDGRAEEDFDRAASLNNNALRLSVEWSRIEPEPGRWDDSALDRYREMGRALRVRGLEPMVTLHHFTNPLWLEERGGWLCPETSGLFARYAAKVVAALGDQVRLWCTINEPVVYAALGHLVGKWPPGHHNPNEAFTAMVHLARGHAAAYHAIKSMHPAAQVGFAKHQITFQARGFPLLSHLGAALLHGLFNEAFFGPFVSGWLRLPLRRAIPMPEARGTLDWIGLQYYDRYMVRFNPAKPEMAFFEQYARPDVPHGPGDWGEFAPEESFPRIVHLYRLVKRPVYITEMGVPDADDRLRPGYLARTLRWVWRACMHGFPVKGFFWWSLVDNFEWAEGYDPRYRFGLYGVDFATQERSERRSARLYRAVCAANALAADMVRAHAPDALPDVFPEPRTRF